MCVNGTILFIHKHFRESSCSLLWTRKKNRKINENIWRAMNGIFKGQQKDFFFSFLNFCVFLYIWFRIKYELNETYFFANASNKFSLSTRTSLHFFFVRYYIECIEILNKTRNSLKLFLSYFCVWCAFGRKWEKNKVITFNSLLFQFF